MGAAQECARGRKGLFAITHKAMLMDFILMELITSNSGLQGAFIKEGKHK